MRPEDFTIEFDHWEGDDDRGCEWNLTVRCPANDGWESVVGAPEIPNNKLGEALGAARKHIAEAHPEQRT